MVLCHGSHGKLIQEPLTCCVARATELTIIELFVPGTAPGALCKEILFNHPNKPKRQIVFLRFPNEEIEVQRLRNLLKGTQLLRHRAGSKLQCDSGMHVLEPLPDLVKETIIRNQWDKGVGSTCVRGQYYYREI